MDTEQEEILGLLDSIPGKKSFYYRNLSTGETWSLNPKLPLVAASVIKLPVLVETFARMEAGGVNKTELHSVRREEKLPSCGALNYLHDGLEVTLEDLYTLMIILSDNTAANILIRKFGMDRINARMRELGLTVTAVNRLLFDAQASAKGIENYICAEEIGSLLERMARGTLVSPAASTEMLRILKDQRLNGKMPFYLHGKVQIAHKTGEDDGITHDVGVVFAPQPFVACFCSNETDVPRFERAIQDVSLRLFERQARR